MIDESLNEIRRLLLDRSFAVALGKFEGLIFALKTNVEPIKDELLLADLDVDSLTRESLERCGFTHVSQVMAIDPADLEIRMSQCGQKRMNKLLEQCNQAVHGGH